MEGGCGEQSEQWEALLPLGQMEAGDSQRKWSEGEGTQQWEQFIVVIKSRDSGAQSQRKLCFVLALCLR